MTTLATAWMLGCVCGFFMGVTVAGRRKPTCREQMRPAAWRSGELVRMDEGRVQRGNGNGTPATPKPDIIPKHQLAGGYQPRPQGGTPNPPPREP
jgi:hypothetical protein